MRRLRLGVGGSLYKRPGEASYTVDLSKLRHKTRCVPHPPRRRSCCALSVTSSLLRPSRFYGPQVSTLPAAIQPFVEAYEKSLVFEPTGDNPYLFSMQRSYQYGHSSSAWSQLVKACFQRHAGVACPPKLLRASFCTFLRSAEGIDDELLESCAKAMKHQKATGVRATRANAH